jgi:hypothetical protein
MEKLPTEIREQCIREIIESDMEQFYKPRDIFDAFYNGILPYKEMSDEEIIEWYEEREEELPTIGLKN